MTMETKATSTKKQMGGLGRIRLVCICAVVVLTIAGFCANLFKSGDENSTMVKTAVAAEQVPQWSQKTDTDAEMVYLTTTETDVRTTPGEISEVIGTLNSGVSISARPSAVDTDWYYVKDYDGYVHVSSLKKVAIEDIIGVVSVKHDINPYYYATPEVAEERTFVENYMTYYSRPFIYNDKYVKIGEKAYISRDQVTIAYYEKDYFKRYIQMDVSRGPVMVAQPFRKRVPDITMVIHQPSGCTVEELNTMTRGTGLDGLGQVLKEIEEANSVNGIFALAVAQLESGHGTSYLARHQNNIFGLDPYNGGMTFETKEDCVRYFGRLIERHYFGEGLTSLYDINQMYEPYNDNWSYLVQSLMNANRTKIGR